MHGVAAHRCRRRKSRRGVVFLPGSAVNVGINGGRFQYQYGTSSPDGAVSPEGFSLGLRASDDSSAEKIGSGLDFVYWDTAYNGGGKVTMTDISMNPGKMGWANLSSGDWNANKFNVRSGVILMSLRRTARGQTMQSFFLMGRSFAAYLSLLVVLSTVSTSSAQNSPVVTRPLERFYLHYVYPNTIWDPSVGSSLLTYSHFTSSPPLVACLQPGCGSNPYPIDAWVALTAQYSERYVEVYGQLVGPCPLTPSYVDRGTLPDTRTEIRRSWVRSQPLTNITECGGPPVWTLTESVLYGAPLRRKALDGSQYDASAMVMLRNGFPWVTYHWGYRLGMVANTSTWDPANLVKVPALATWPTGPNQTSFPDASRDLELVALPPPWVEDEVLEYVNRADFPKQPAGQYFYAVLPADKALLDATANWSRTGNAFKSGGYVSVCRFYGGKNGGPNTHFYSADEKECDLLKGIPALSYEGQTFAVNMPMPAKNEAQAVAGALRACPVASRPLYRLYNNASASSGKFVSNHRYTTNRNDVAAAVGQGWLDEGHVMCVPD